MSKQVSRQITLAKKDLYKVEREELQLKRNIDEAKLINEPSYGKNIVYSKYLKDEQLPIMRETGIPPESLFIPLGHNPEPDKDTKVKHYRRFFPKPLEKVKEIMPVPTPFDVYSIKRG